MITCDPRQGQLQTTNLPNLFACGHFFVFKSYVRQLESQQHAVVPCSQVICCTLTGVLGHNLNGVYFDVAFVDEAAQVGAVMTAFLFSVQCSHLVYFKRS